jgi:hypothetical protein
LLFRQDQGQLQLAPSQAEWSLHLREKLRQELLLQELLLQEQ